MCSGGGARAPLSASVGGGEEGLGLGCDPGEIVPFPVVPFSVEEWGARGFRHRVFDETSHARERARVEEEEGKGASVGETPNNMTAIAIE